MLSRLRLFAGALAIGLLFSGMPCRISGQQPGPAPVPVIAATLPDAPQWQGSSTAPDGLNFSSSLEEQSTPAQTPAQSSSSQTPAPQPAQGETDREKAEEQLKEQEHQRVAGVMATFNTTRNRDALPLSPSQKFRLFFKSSTDPWPFLLAGVVSGIGQINNNPHEWGQGLKGYAKRFGGNYADAFIGNFFGNAVLPVALKEDPRYFQKGSGNPFKRVLWAASSTFWCRRDNGKWGPNYANVGGNLIGAAIARAYYPESERDVADTVNDGLTVSVEGIAGAEVIEFWPDLARHIKRKHDQKMARKAAQIAAKGTAQPDGK